MRFICLLFTILISVSAWAELEIKNDWKLKNQLGGTKFFLKKDMFLSVLEGDVPEVRILTPNNYKAEITKSLTIRKSTLKMLGYTSWEADQILFQEPVPGKKVIQLVGQFEKAGEKFEFTEWQVYIEKKYLSLQIETKVGDKNFEKEKVYFSRLIEAVK